MERGRAARVALMIALCAATAIPCSWDYTPAFTFRVRPDDPIEEYVDGRIGIIGREYARSHLVVAYRYLSGNPPSDAEREGFLALLQHRLKEVTPEDHGKAWEQLRGEYRGVKPGYGPYTLRSSGRYEFFDNCTSDAFLKAATVLRDRSARFGAQSPAILSWLEAQEMVFANCSEGEVIPKPADASLPALIRFDRAYQIAAAKFYAMKYDDARADFLAIAANKGSPWWQTARLVAARALLRKATVLNAEGQLEQGERDLRAILADPSMAPMHEPARKLLNFAVFRLRPEERLKELAAALMRGSATADEARRNLDDYTYLLDKLEGERSDDLTTWIRTFQSGKDATAQWKATKKLHWLVAALAVESPTDVNELLEASSNIAPDSVAYPLIAYHRIRLTKSRAELDRVLSLDESKLPTSARNLLLTQRRPLARSFAEYLRDVPVMPVGLEADQTLDETYNAPLLPPDAAAVMTEAMPLEMLAEAAAHKELSREIRDPILVAAWTRAILLDRQDVASRLAPLVFALRPEIKKRFIAWRDAEPSQRRFAAADLIAHHDGHTANIIAFGTSFKDAAEGWWCPDRSSDPLPIPPFLADAKISEAAASERAALLERGAGATYLLRAFIDLANAQPQDPRAAEGLSIAVKGTRRSCGDETTDKLAQQAFNLLHKRYANTRWAKETPYWYRSGY